VAVRCNETITARGWDHAVSAVGQHRGAGLSVIGLGAWQFGGEWGKDFNAERGRPAGGPGG